MLRNRKSSQSSVESSTGQCDDRLLHEEFQIHLPNPGHLVQESQGLLEQRVHLVVLCSKDGRVELGDMFDSEVKELAWLAVLEAKYRRVRHTSFQSLYDRGN